MGGFAVVNALLPLLLIVAVRIARERMEAALGECGQFLVPFIPGAILAYLVMGLVWPWAVVSPLNPFRAVEYFSNFFERPWRELFDGQMILVPDMPRSYVPTLAALTLPELMLALGFCGMVGAIVVAARGRPGRLGASAGRRAALLAVVLAALLPVVVTVATRPAMYNGIRHFVFLTPPFAVLGGLAAAWIARRLERYGRSAMAAGAAILIAGFASPIVDMVRLHPYEYTHFNHIAGGVAGARPLLHARLLGIVDTTGLAGIADGSCAARRNARAAKNGRSPSADRIRRPWWRWVRNIRPSGIRKAPTSP